MWVWCIRAQVLYAWLCAHTCVYVCAWDTRSDGSEWGVGGGQHKISNSWGNARGGGGGVRAVCKSSTMTLVHTMTLLHTALFM